MFVLVDLAKVSLATISLTAVTLVVSTMLAVLIAPLATSGHILVRRAIGLYTWLGRAVPELIFVYLAFYGLFQVGIDLDPFPSVVVAFVFFSTAFIVEIYRGGLLGVPNGQRDAIKALGLTPLRGYFGVILPQATRIIVPAYLTNATAVLKATSMASLVTILEISSLANKFVQAHPSDAMGILLQAAVVYIVLCSVLLAVQVVLSRRWSGGRARIRI